MQQSAARQCTHGVASGPVTSWRRPVVAAASSAKKLKYAGVGQRLVREPLVVSLQPDGSDTWRLEPVFELLQSGGVSGTLADRPR